MGDGVDSVAAPQVSVVVTTYNVAPYIGDALRSALGQTFGDTEIIVVDDGSQDATLEVVRTFQDARLRLLELPHSGPVLALNAGISAARGEFLAFLDGDDVWHPGKLARHLQFLREHPDIDLTCSWYRMIDERGQDTGLAFTKGCGRISFSQLLTDNPIGNGSSVVLRRKAMLDCGLFDPSYPACYDLDAWLRLARLRPANLECVPEILTDYRRREGQMTRDAGLMERGWNQLLANMHRLAPEETAQVAAVARSNMSRFWAFAAYENANYRQAASYLGRGFRQAPWAFLRDSRNWKLLAATTAGWLLPAAVHRRLLRRVLRLQTRC